MADLNRTIDRSIRISRSVADLMQRRLRAAGERYTGRVRAAQAACFEGLGAKTPFEFARQWTEYTIDAAQRSVLYWDTLRQRGNQWIEHERAGKPPVLSYEYEVHRGRAQVRASGQLRAACASCRRKAWRSTTASARSSSSIRAPATARASAASRRTPKSASRCAPAIRCTS